MRHFICSSIRNFGAILSNSHRAISPFRFSKRHRDCAMKIRDFRLKFFAPIFGSNFRLRFPKRHRDCAMKIRDCRLKFLTISVSNFRLRFLALIFASDAQSAIEIWHYGNQRFPAQIFGYDFRLWFSAAILKVQSRLRYRVAKTHRIPYLYRLFSAKVTYI